MPPDIVCPKCKNVLTKVCYMIDHGYEDYSVEENEGGFYLKLRNSEITDTSGPFCCNCEWPVGRVLEEHDVAY